MTVQLAMYKGKGRFSDAVIRFWTGSQYSHCELVVAGRCYSSSLRDGGVRTKKVGAWPDMIDLGSGNWDVVDVPWVTRDMVEDHFIATRHYKYGVWGLLINQVFNMARPTPQAVFCSEWCAAALGLPNAVLYSPASLYTLVQWMNVRR